MYREYTVMQPLQRSYAITIERINNMVASGALNSLYDAAKVAKLENAEELTGKDKKKLQNYLDNKPVCEAIMQALYDNVSDELFMSPKPFLEHLSFVFSGTNIDKKLIEKIAHGLSVMDKNAEIQRDKKGNVIYDKETKDTEIVKYEEDIETYMKREVLPHVPDAQWFFEENISAKKLLSKQAQKFRLHDIFISTSSQSRARSWKNSSLNWRSRLVKELLNCLGKEYFMARNKSNNSQYIKTDINYDKLAEAIVKAHKRIKDTEEKEAQRREKKEREDWLKTIGCKEIKDDWIWRKKKWQSFKNDYASFKSIITYKAKDAKTPRLSFELIRLGTSMIYVISYLILYIIAVFFLSTLIFLTGFDKTYSILAIPAFLFARIIRIAELEVKNLKDRELLNTIFTANMTFIGVVLAAVAIIVEVFS